MKTTATAALFASLDTITHETRRMLTALDTAQDAQPEHVRAARVRVEQMRAQAQELFDLLSEVWLEEPTN
jgi:hypothetical protein